jgi:hypothetical protein
MDRIVKISYYIMFLFIIVFMVIEYKYKGYNLDYGYNIFTQIGFYLFILILINLAIHYIKKIKNKDVRQEVLYIPENLEISFEGSLFHIISLIISLGLSFLVFSLVYTMFLFDEYFVIQALGMFFITLPIFYQLSYNYIAYRKLYIKKKKSKPILMPIASSLIALFGFGIIILDIIKMFISYNILVSIEYAVYLFILFILVLPVHKYFLLIQKLEIRQEDVVDCDSNGRPIIKN